MLLRAISLDSVLPCAHERGFCLGFLVFGSGLLLCVISLDYVLLRARECGFGLGWLGLGLKGTNIGPERVMYVGVLVMSCAHVPMLCPCA